MPTKKTKAMLEEENAELMRQIEEAKRQQTHIPVQIGNSEDDGGSHAIDHLTLLDNHEAPDINREPIEDIQARERADLSFWNGSWTWTEAATSYGDRPQDKYFINPTPKLVAEVMNNAPTVFSACEVQLVAGDHKEQLDRERRRHVDFLRDAEAGDIVSEGLDLLTAYQSRYFEAVQRYIGLCASYQNQVDNPNLSQEQLEAAEMKKHNAGGVCRAWAAKLIALVEAYHNVVTDERAYQLTYNFAPMPPEDGKPASREYSLFRWSVTNTLNKVGRRLARSIKDGKMDATKYRIPLPWISEDQKAKTLDANAMLSDFA
jgi:hypothetical protein